MVELAGDRTIEASSQPVVEIVGSAPIRTKSLPVPLKSFDCLAAVVQVKEPHDVGAVAVTSTLTDSPGSRRLVEPGPGLRSSIWPETRVAVHTLPGGGVTAPTVTDVKSAGTLMLAEPSDCVLA